MAKLKEAPTNEAKIKPYRLSSRISNPKKVGCFMSDIQPGAALAALRHTETKPCEKCGEVRTRLKGWMLCEKCISKKTSAKHNAQKKQRAFDEALEKYLLEKSRYNPLETFTRYQERELILARSYAHGASGMRKNAFIATLDAEDKEGMNVILIETFDQGRASRKAK